jgi:hypothetical protein
MAPKSSYPPKSSSSSPSRPIILSSSL